MAAILSRAQCVNILGSDNNMYKCQWLVSPLVLVMICYLLGAKPLPETMMTYHQLHHKEVILVEFGLKFTIISCEENAFETVIYKLAANFVEALIYTNTPAYAY